MRGVSVPIPKGSVMMGVLFANHMMAWEIKYNHITEFGLGSGMATAWT